MSYPQARTPFPSKQEIWDRVPDYEGVAHFSFHYGFESGYWDRPEHKKGLDSMGEKGSKFFLIGYEWGEAQRRKEIETV